MKKILLTFTLFLTMLALSGCASPLVKSFSDAAEEHVREKWADEWKPLLMAELKLSAAELKDEVLADVEGDVQAKLDQIGVDANQSDLNKDGQLDLKEAVVLLRDIHEKNENAPAPLTLIEIAAIMAAIYGGGSTLKGGARMLANKRTGTGSGQVQPAA